MKYRVPTSVRELKKLAWHIQHTEGIKHAAAQAAAAWHAGFNSYREAKDALGQSQVREGPEADGVGQ